MTYTFTATNPGNETLTGVDITDSANFTGLSGLTCRGRGDERLDHPGPGRV